MIGAMFETNISYRKLDDLLEETITNIKYSNNVNVLIDLKSVLKKAYRMDIDNLLNDFHVVIEDITSHIINMIGHYRNYLYKHGKYSTFYILYSKSECELLKEIYSDYKKYYYDKYLSSDNEFKNLNNSIKSAIHSLEILVKYIPHVYFIDTSLVDEFIYSNFLIREHLNKNDINLLLSNDPIMYQALSKNTFAIDLKGNNSSLITENNVMKYLTEKDTSLRSNLLTFLLSLSGDETYSLEKMNNYGYKKSLKLIEKLIHNNYLVDKMYMKLPEDELEKEPSLAGFLPNMRVMFNILFPIEVQIKKYHEINININLAELEKSKATYKQFKELNDRVYLLYPINIRSLLKGEDIE